MEKLLQNYMSCVTTTTDSLHASAEFGFNRLSTFACSIETDAQYIPCQTAAMNNNKKKKPKELMHPIKKNLPRLKLQIVP